MGADKWYIPVFSLLFITAMCKQCPARDPLLQPFSAHSPWNMPVGSLARYDSIPGISAYSGSMNYASAFTTGIYAAATSDRQAKLYIHDPGSLEGALANGSVKNAGNPDSTEQRLRAESTPTESYAANPYSTIVASPPGQRTWPTNIRTITAGWTNTIYVPAGAAPSADPDGHLAIYQPGGLVLECYGAVVCGNGDVVAGMAGFSDPLGDGTGYDNGRCASMLPNYAGKIRKGEITNGVIPHALSCNISRLLLKKAIQWPAFAFDMNDNYSGILPMGCLLAIPPNVNINTLALSAQGKIVAKAAQDYGIYAVDRGGDGGLGIYIALDAGDALDPAYSETQRAYDAIAIVHALKWIANNGPDSIGGGGIPRAPLAQPLPGELAATLVWPVNAATGVAVNPTLRWNKTAGATSYRIQVSTAADFGSTIKDSSTITDTSCSFVGLTNSILYYWRVNAANAGASSVWSGVRSFTTVAITTAVAPLTADIKSFFCRMTKNTINYALPKSCFVSIKYYDLQGRTVFSFVNKYQEAGNYTLKLPERLSRNVYIREFRAGNFVKKEQLTMR
ncbi:MAG: fibronectin type III domain-containing protein [Chitinivibrionales bacterium]|nr:fibronectin type III domain-containing protein [Chitinivibrionales bacterium]